MTSPALLLEPLSAIDESIALLRAAGITPSGRTSTGVADPVRIIDDCLDLIASDPGAIATPIRTVHHFACTGGTLLSKCLSAMPNVRLLSEVDPFSTLTFDPARPSFAPTDLITLLRQGSRRDDPALIARLFEQQVRTIHEDCVAKAVRLVIRDHAHSHFCVGAMVPARPTLLELLPRGIPVRSVVTVRHPVDSFASLGQNGWISFAPADFDEYCLRYHHFLDAYAGTPIVRYEDVVAEPARFMRVIADRLELTFFDRFEDVFGVFRVTGDSGRSGSVIGARPRHPEAVDLATRYRGVAVYERLLERMGYA